MPKPHTGPRRERWPTILGTPEDGSVVDVSLINALLTLAGQGLIVRTADGWAIRTMIAPAAGMVIANPSGAAGNPTFFLANDLKALENLNGTGFAKRTGGDSWTLVANLASEITLTNATEAASGVAELATQPETDLGQDDEKIVTPLKLANSPSRLTISLMTMGA